MNPLMKCGHIAQGHDENNNPICVICFGITQNALIVVEENNIPSLEGRKAKCTYCGNIRDSSYDLAFFEYHGNGSYNAINSCKNCRYYEVAHNSDSRNINKNICDNFEPIGDTIDIYYCGCRGWD